jgi:hypothetical protein
MELTEALEWEFNMEDQRPRKTIHVPVASLLTETGFRPS